MHRSSKRLLALLLALLLCLSLFPAAFAEEPVGELALDGPEEDPSASPDGSAQDDTGDDPDALPPAADDLQDVTASGECGDNLTWTLDEDGLFTVSGTGDMWDWNGGNMPWYDSMGGIVVVTLLPGVTGVGDTAFSAAHALNQVNFPDGLTRIGLFAFMECVGLTEVSLPATLTTIEDGAFEMCGGLTEITIPAGVTLLGPEVFLGCEALETLYFQGGAPSIGVDAFLGVTATAYYPANDPTWTEEVRQNYGGSITWVAYEPEAPAIPIDEEHFPDPNFRSYVAENCDPNRDGLLSEEERLAVTTIDVSSRRLTSLEGIALFPALTVLWCGGNQLTALDLSQNPALERLDCYRSYMTALNLSQNQALTELWCPGNQLTALDLSHNPALKQLTCESNRLTALDLSRNPALTDLNCDNNQLTALDLSRNPALTYLYCRNNQLTALDLSQNPALTALYCYSNQLTALDLSQNPALTHLHCYGNQIPSLDLRPCPELLAISMTEPTGNPDWCEPYEGVVAYGQDMGGWFDYRLVVDETTRLITDDLTLTLTDAEARPGETFTVTLQLTNNPGVTGLSAEVVYDESVMTLLSATPKIESGTWSVDSIAADHLIFWYDTETFAGEDVIELSFRVADDAPEGSFPIGLQFGDWDSIVDAEGEEITAYSVVPGTLTVTHRIPGDVNGDGKVNLSDVVRLAQYVKARGQGVEIVLNSGDTNGDGKVNLSDVVRLAQYVKARGVGVVIY